MKILLAGCGDIATEVGKELKESGNFVTGVRRNLPITTSFNYKSIDLSIKKQLTKLDNDYDIVMFSVTPDKRDESSYRDVFNSLNNLVTTLKNNSTKKVFFIFISSISVYGQHNGEIISEESETKPNKFNGKYTLKSEELIKYNFNNHLIIRFSGIYSGKRNLFLNKIKNNFDFSNSYYEWTNRIHRDDCIKSILFLIYKIKLNVSLDNIYLISDDLPIKKINIINSIRAKLGLSIVPNEYNYNLNKICNNSRIKNLGYKFIYPSYIEGYQIRI